MRNYDNIPRYIWPLQLWAQLERMSPISASILIFLSNILINYKLLASCSDEDTLVLTHVVRIFIVSTCIVYIYVLLHK